MNCGDANLPAGSNGRSIEGVDSGQGSDEARLVSRAEFTLGQRDYRATIGHSLRARASFQIVVWLFVVILLGGIVMATKGERLSWVCIGSGVVGLAWMAIQPKRIADRTLTNPIATESRSYVFDDEGVRLRTSTTDARLGWENFDSCDEWNGRFVLRVANSGQHIYIPMKGFLSPADEESFRMLVTRYL